MMYAQLYYSMIWYKYGDTIGSLIANSDHFKMSLHFCGVFYFAVNRVELVNSTNIAEITKNKE